MKKQKGIRASIYEIIKNAGQPLTTDEIILELGKIIPLKKPKQQVRNALSSSDFTKVLFVSVGGGKYDLIEKVVKNNWYRYTISEFDIKEGILPCDDELHFIFDHFWQEKKRVLKFHNANEEIILQSNVGYTGRTLSPRRVIPNFKDWFLKEEAIAGDDVLIKIIDFIDGKYIVRLERKKDRNENLIQKKNTEVAEVMINVLNKIASKGTWPSELLMRVSGLYSYKDATPPDQLIKIALSDKRFLVYQYDLISIVEIYLADKVRPGLFGRPVPKTHQRFFIDDFNDDDNNFPPFGLIH